MRETIPDAEFYAIEMAMRAAESKAKRPRVHQGHDAGGAIRGFGGPPPAQHVNGGPANVNRGVGVGQPPRQGIQNVYPPPRAAPPPCRPPPSSSGAQAFSSYAYGAHPNQNPQTHGGASRPPIYSQHNGSGGKYHHHQQQSQSHYYGQGHRGSAAGVGTSAMARGPAPGPPRSPAALQQQHQQQQQRQLPQSLGPNAMAAPRQQVQGQGSDRTLWNGPPEPQAPPARNVPSVQTTIQLSGNGERIGVFINGRNDTLESFLRQMKDCSWSKAEKMWTFPVGSHDQVVTALREMKQLTCKVEPLHPFALRMIQSAKQQKCSDEEVDRVFQGIPNHLQDKLMDFQTKGVRFALKLSGRALIGDEMGLGKTVQALALVAAYRDSWPVLIVTPSSLKIQWADAIHEWLRVTEEHVAVVSNGKDTKALASRFVIMSYDFVPKMYLQLKERNFQMIICDEAHYIKNHKSKRSKDTLPLLQQAKRVVLLTGTPALSRPIELLQLLRAVHPKAVRSMKEYGDRYCSGGYWNKFPGAMYNGASNLKELHQVVTSTTMVRRLKKEVLSELPSKRRQQVMLPITSAEIRQLKKVTAEVESISEGLKDGSLPGGIESVFGGELAQKSMVNQLYLKTAEIKAKLVCEYVNVMLAADEKFLVFGHHKCMLDAIESNLREKKVKFIRIDGSTPSSERYTHVQTFQENADFKVAVLSIKAAGVGLTLTAASVVVMAELDWVPGNLVQAEDRAHRIGQASSVNVYYLHLKGSVDDLIWRLLQRKLNAVGEMLDGHGDKLVTGTPTPNSAGFDASKTPKGKKITNFFKKKE